MLAEQLDDSDDVAPDDPAGLAAEALRLVGIDAALAESTANNAIAAARRQGNASAESMAWRARGLAARELEQLEVAEVHLRKAVAVGRKAGEQATAEAQMSLALVQLGRGNLTGARRTGRRAVAALSGREQARARIQLALIEQRSGALREAMDTYAMALTQLRRYGDELWEARLRNNRGILQAYRGEVAAAERDLVRAEELYRRQGQDVLAADVLWNRGFVAGLAGDAVSALRLFEEAGAALVAAGVSRGSHFLDRAQVLLSVGLVEESLAVLETALDDLELHGVQSDVAEATLLLAETRLLAGDRAGARTAGQQALEALSQQGRPGLALLASYAILKAQALDLTAPEWTRAESVVAALRTAGWHVAATDLRTMAAQRAVGSGVAVEPDLLAEVLLATRSGPAAQRMRAWHAVALCRLSVHDRRGALAALRAGLQVHDRHRASMTATELQVRVAGRARDLAETGLMVALASGRPRDVFAWSERWRAGSLSLRPVQPPSDSVLAGQLTELRAVTAEFEQAMSEGRPPEAFLRRQRSLEARIANQARLSRTGLRQTPQPSARQVRDQLGDRVLLEFVEVDGELVVVVLDSTRCTMQRLGPVSVVVAELESLRFGLRRLALGGSDRMLHAAGTSVAAAAQALDDRLLRPVRRRVADRPLVVVPTGELHALPWSLLPSMRVVAVTVAPSASAWLAAESAEPRDGHLALVAGPGLAAARREVLGVASVYGDEATVVLSEEASVAAVTSCIDGARCAHIAAHGSFRSENALFSSLQMRDGALTVYDLERLHAAPEVVVLSACDSGLSLVHPGNELMGLIGAMLRIGTRALVASVAPVPDGVAHATMVGFHAGLKQGQRPSVALQHALDGLTEGDRLRASAFVCFGAG